MVLSRMVASLDQTSAELFDRLFDARGLSRGKATHMYILLNLLYLSNSAGWLTPHEPNQSSRPIDTLSSILPRQRVTA